MNKAQQIMFLCEEIYGAMSIGYHRTNEHGIMALGLRGGHFLNKEGAMSYGAGVYLTYYLEDQFNEYMVRHYGEYILKCKVNLNRFLIFDEQVAATVYGWKNRSWYNQLQNIFHVTPSKFLGQAFESIGRLSMGVHYTSQIATAVLEAVGYTKLSHLVRGVVFTGGHDGHVIVAYDFKSVTPLAFAEAPLGQHNPVFEPVSKINKETLNRNVGRIEQEGEVKAKIVRKGIQRFLDTIKSSGLHIVTGGVTFGEANFEEDGKLGILLQVNIQAEREPRTELGHLVRDMSLPDYDDPNYEHNVAHFKSIFKSFAQRTIPHVEVRSINYRVGSYDPDVIITLFLVPQAPLELPDEYNISFPIRDGRLVSK